MRIDTWEEAERGMAEYGRLWREARKFAASEEEAVERVRADYAQRRGGGEAKRKKLERSLQHFARARKRQFQPAPQGPGRSFSSNGVRIGFRLTPPAVRISSQAATVQWLVEAHLEGFLRITRQPDREALKSALSNGDPAERDLVERLAAHGIRLEQSNKFFIEALSH